jgi:hypothetical protein
VKTVLKLVLTYFTGTPLLAVITALGIVGVVGGSAVFQYLPPLLGGPSSFSLGMMTVITLTPAAGVIGVAFGASLLPTLFARLAASHYLYVLPYGRIKLLASVFVTLALVALVAAATTTAYYVRTPLQLDVVFARAFVVSLLTCNLLYVVVWLTGKSTSALWLLLGSIAAIGTLLVPLPFIALPSRSLAGPWVASLVLWALFATAFLLAPRFKGRVGRIRQAIAARFSGAPYRGGGEIDFVLGTGRPWALAFGQVVPILVAAYFLRGFAVMAPSAQNPLLFFMTILSILAGAIASLAATRSRSLWLRAHWSRAELFRRVEDALWRHNSAALGVLLVVLVVIGTNFYVAKTTLMFGIGLVMLAVALSTYLGLMITARIGWLEAVLAVATMLLLMATANYAGRPATPATVVVAFEAVLAALVLIFRTVAQRRWTRIDWMRCRADGHVRAAT